MKEFLKKWRYYLVYAGFFSLFINLLQLTFSFYMMLVYDRVLASYSMPTLIVITLAAFAALGVGAILEFIRSRVLLRCGINIDLALSKDVLDNVLKENALPGAPPAASLRDVNLLRNFFSGSAIFSLFDIPWMPVYFAVIFYLHPVLGLFAMGGGIILVALALVNERISREPLEYADRISARANDFFSLANDNAEVVRGMGMIGAITDRWQLINSAVIKLQTVASRQTGLVQAITGGFRQMMQVGIYGVGAYLALNYQSSAGCMITASIVMGRALAPIQTSISTWKSVVEARSAYNRLDLLFEQREIAEPMDLPDPKGRLVVERINFMLQEHNILQDITFDLQPGETMGMIGPSGAGKSTLCRLLLGIWPVADGEITLDGVDIFAWDQELLGRHIGYLPQEIELFSGTVSLNICRFSEVDSEKVIGAAQAAGVHELILNLPMGYDTPVGPGGMPLSGGQRQRIGLARALYDNPCLLIMDEPNSNLDDLGEAALLKAWGKLKERDGTLVVVTHKPSLLAGMDKILVLKEGRQAAYGPRAEIFRNLVAAAPDKGKKAASLQPAPVTVPVPRPA